jgi:two-component system cell cycle sensor histidine kinase/response regulator CckA
MVQRLIDAVDALVVVAATDCTLWLWNERCDATSGVPLADVAGKPLWSVMRLRPNLSAVAQDAFDRLISGEERKVEFRAQWLRKDGRKARVSWTASLVEGAGGRKFVVATGVEQTRGRQPAVELVARDITARKVTEAALRASEARVGAVFDQSSMGMLLIDSDGRAVEANAAFMKLVQYDAAEIEKLTVLDLTHPADRDATRRLMADLFLGLNNGYELEKRYIAKSGREIWTRVHVSPVRAAQGLPHLAVSLVEDISEREAMEEQFRQTSKMEALGRLAGGVAHDFNNLLTVVNGYADLLVMSLDGDERSADALEIRRAGSRAAELTAQLLALGRRSKRALEPVDLNRRIEDMVPMLRRLLGEDIEFGVTLDQSLGAVEADPSQLDQVVMNLVVNGRDAMQNGGSLTLSTSVQAPGGPGARLGPNGWARLEIADSGFGMEPELLEHIFEPFFTTKDQGRGTGLGLATVYGIVQQMGGNIRVESAVGVGSRFIVELPLCEAPTP